MPEYLYLNCIDLFPFLHLFPGCFLRFSFNMVFQNSKTTFFKENECCSACSELLWCNQEWISPSLSVKRCVMSVLISRCVLYVIVCVITGSWTVSAVRHVPAICLITTPPWASPSLCPFGVWAVGKCAFDDKWCVYCTFIIYWEEIRWYEIE